MKTMKKLIWLLPLLIILGAMFVAVEIKGSSPTHEITISYGHLVDTSGRSHLVQLVLHPDGSVSLARFNASYSMKRAHIRAALAHCGWVSDGIDFDIVISLAFSRFFKQEV